MNVSRDALFVDGETSPKYKDLEQEFEALIHGSRKLCSFIFPTEKFTSDDGYIEICESAQKLGLAVITQKMPTNTLDPRLQFTYVFVLANDQLWRVPAFISLKKIFNHYGWCDGAEHFEGELMGFTQNEIGAWIADHHSARSGWLGKTLYAILTTNQIRDIRALGGRAFMPQSTEGPLEVFFSRSNRRISPLARSLVGDMGALVRFEVYDTFVRKNIYDNLKTNNNDIALIKIPFEMIADLNSALTSDIEENTGEGWTFCR